jgi:hypothetical protein
VLAIERRKRGSSREIIEASRNGDLTLPEPTPLRALIDVLDQNIYPTIASATMIHDERDEQQGLAF